MGQFMNRRITVWFCTFTLVALLAGGKTSAAPTSADLPAIGITPDYPHQTSVTPAEATTTPSDVAAPLDMGVEMVTPAALMELLPHEKQQQKEQLLRQQEMLERLRVENEKKLWAEREALRVAYALENSSEEDEAASTTEPTLRSTQVATTIKSSDVTMPGGKKKRPENPILKKFKISNSRGIMVFRSAPTTPRVITTTKLRITTEPATTSTTTKTTTTTTAEESITTGEGELAEIDGEITETVSTSTGASAITTTSETSATSLESIEMMSTTKQEATTTTTPNSEVPLSSIGVPTETVFTLGPKSDEVKSTESQTSEAPATTSLPAQISSTSSLAIELESPEVNSIPSNEEEEEGEQTPAAVNLKPSTTTAVAQDAKHTKVYTEDSMEMQNDQPSMALEDDNSLQSSQGAAELHDKTDSPSVEKHKEGLIDMKYHNAKLLAEAHKVQVNATHKDDSAGHDGVKKTKKKQLIDNQVESLDVAMGEVNGGEIVPKVVVAKHTDEPSMAQKMRKKASLKPVRNGFLGPLIMGEKIFSIGKQKSQQQKHEASIESQLKEGRIVEIIAPTVGEMEPTITTTLETSTAEEKLSSTVFTVSDSLASSTRLPTTNGRDIVNEATPNAEQTESKISDIQIEVYDSTVDSIVASTNFKDTDAYRSQPLEVSPLTGTTKPAVSVGTQERFTQYVVDRTDSSTPESYIGANQALMMGGVGKPEPAAIEIHINVSEGISGSDSEDLEFSYPQTDYVNDNERRSKGSSSAQISLKPFVGAETASAQGEQSPSSGSNNSDEILVVEIIDTGENNTDQSSSAENINPVFTFRSSGETEEDTMPHKTAASRTDELFLADVKKDELAGSSYLHPAPPAPPTLPRRPSVIDRDSDTIFYISNTEVKVGESLPPGPNEQERRAQLESQFFPVNYVASTHPNAPTNLLNGGGDGVDAERQHRYEEDIILSPLRNTADSLKIFRSETDVVDNPSPPLDVTYVGESVMEVEQLPSAGITTLPPSQTQQSQQPDVDIQPGIVPEMSIGVPVIGELPPQIELKEIDFMPDEANQLRSGVYDTNSIDVPSSNGNSNNNDNDSDSIQYGGDLIDLGASSNSFDGIEGSYPFGDGDSYAGLHYVHSHGGSHLRRDELSADVGGGGGASAETNDTLKEALANATTTVNGNATSAGANNMRPMAERRINTSTTDAADQVSNATSAVHSEKGGTNGSDDDWKNTLGLTIGLFFILTPVVVTVSMACALRYLYYKYHRNSPDSTEANDNEAGNHNTGANGHTGESTQPPSPSISEQDTDCKTTQPNQNLHTNAKPSNNNNTNLDTIDEKSNDAHTDDSKTESKSITDSIDTVGGGGVGGICGVDQPQQQQNEKHKQKQQLSLITTSVHGGGGPNGSVTKMTLKNNHLIVETEERNDISRDARETKMTYNGNDKDSIFVVEVSRGVDSKAIPESPISENGDHRFPGLECKTKSALPLKELASNAEGPIKKHQQVEVHPPPPELQGLPTAAEDNQRSLHQIEEVEEEQPAAALLEKNCKTGLSQSDLSSSSSTDSNKRYSYGNQQMYVIEAPGYESSLTNTFVTATVHVAEGQRDDDHKSENGHSLGYYPEAEQQKFNGEEIEEKENALEDAGEEVLRGGEKEVEKKEEQAEQQLSQAGEKDLEALKEGEGKVEIDTNIDGKKIGDATIDTKTEDVKVEAKNETKIEPTIEDVKIEAKNEDDKQQPEGIEDIPVETPIQGIENVMKNETVQKDALEEEQQVPAEDTLAPEELAHNESPDGSKDNIPEHDDSEPSTEANETEAGIPPITTEMPDDSTSFVVPDLVRDLQGNHRADMPDCEEADADGDNAMDSMISLPDPPSTEEIRQFNDDGDQNSLLDTNQLDSLPPPPPPLALHDELADGHDEHKRNGYDMEVAIPAPPSFDNNTVTNGNCVAGGEAMNGHDDNSNGEGNGEPKATKTLGTLSHMVGAAAAMLENGNCNGEMMTAATPLTPPASPTTQSPTPKTPLHYTTTMATATTATMNGGMPPLCKPLLPVAVDVNGS